jgi:hypothetical protein
MALSLEEKPGGNQFLSGGAKCIIAGSRGREICELQAK